MKKKNRLKLVNKYFENAQTIQGNFGKKIENIYTLKYGNKDVKGIYANEGEVQVWHPEKGYAKIITYKSKQHTLSESFIKENADKTLKEVFPEVFKVELEVGKYYTPLNNYEGKALFCVVNPDDKENIGYGLNYKGEWKDNFASSSGIPNRLATDSEVTEALTKEAVKRGFKDNIYVQDLGYKTTMKVSGKFNFSGRGILYFGGATIMKDGIWAEIIPTITIKEAEEKLNCKII